MFDFEEFQKLRENKLSTPNEYTKAIGKLVKQAREEQNLTQAQLAERIYRSQVTVSDIENGKIDISFLTIILIALILSKPISYFIPEALDRDVLTGSIGPAGEEIIAIVQNIGFFGGDLDMLIDILKVIEKHSELGYKYDIGELHPDIPEDAA